MVGWRAWALRCAQRASGGTQKMFSAMYSSRSSAASAAPFGENRRMALLEGVGDVFQKDEAQDDVFVFGRVHAAAQGVCHAPKLSLIARGGAVAAGLCVCFGGCFPRLRACHGLLLT